MTSKDSNDICYFYIFISAISAYGISFLLNLDIGSPGFFSFIIPAFFVFLIFYVGLTLYIKKNKKAKKPAIQKRSYQKSSSKPLDFDLVKQYAHLLSSEDQKLLQELYGETFSNNLNYQNKKEAGYNSQKYNEMERQKNEELQKLEEKVNIDLNDISTLLIKNEFKAAGMRLKNCRKIVKSNRFEHLNPKIEGLQMQINLRFENYHRENSARIRKKVLKLGRKEDRLLISEIKEATGVDDENFIIEIIIEMIKNEEIYAEFFKSSKSIVFNVHENTIKIDKLLDTYKEWEDGNIGKKDS